MLAGKQAAQICRKLEERPKTLLPDSKRTGTINPINGPEIHHGQCCLNISIISVEFIGDDIRFIQPMLL
jgi:hypothetical protein